MILKALADYYDVLLSDENIDMPKPGFSSAKVSCAAIISRNGELVDINDLRITSEKGKLVSRDINVPAQGKKTCNICSNFMSDNATYVFGLDIKGKPERTQLAAEEFKRYNLEILDNPKDDALKPFLEFLSTFDISGENESKIIAQNREILEEGGNIVFRMDGEHKYIHQLESVKQAWNVYMERLLDSAEQGQCLVSGEKGPIAKLHPSIKGIVGGQATGTSLVSFNKRSFESYGKTEKQGFNAPVSNRVAAAYTSALNFMTRSRNNHLRIGDATTVFWAEKSHSGIEESVFAELINPSNDESNKKEGKQVDSNAQNTVAKLLDRARKGLPILEKANEAINPESKFYILGLAPNASRVSIRFWHVDKFGTLLENLLMHQLDMTIDRKDENNVISTWKVLKEISVHKDLKNLSPLMAGKLTEAIIRGTQYPQSLYTAVITRIRADNDVNYIRAGLIKACLKRKMRVYDNRKEGDFTVALNHDNKNTGYLLGRLFAVMEKAQKDALGEKINSTIKDRYFSSATATPGAVFPTLVKLAQYHIEKSDYGYARDREIQQIMQSIDSFPAHLNLDDQGQFILGYYHQKQSFYTKKTEDKQGGK
ncbi:MAG: type I-C CRISPR-associated protein Cas8c/Csd1 [Peptostreptococcaceae bacterium]|nr:type I-C CRISPR-associated protein Cas8c/Csd1 [Peptostreptococcaceae bacterium]